MRENDYLDVRQAIVRRARQLRAASAAGAKMPWAIRVILICYAISAAAVLARAWKAALHGF